MIRFAHRALLLLGCLLVIPAAAQNSTGSAVCVVEVKDKHGQVVGTAGKAFATRLGGKGVLVTTAHGISQLMNAPANPLTLLTNVGSVTLMNLAGQEMFDAGPCLSRDNRAGDVLLFELPAGSGMPQLSLAQTLPAVGTRVWVLSKTGHNFANSNTADRFSGRVLQIASGQIYVHMDASLDAFHSSGSPVVDEQDNVLGMLTGVSPDRVIISCLPASSIAQVLNPQSTAPSQSIRQPSGSRLPANYSTNSGGSTPRGVQTYGTVSPGNRSGVQNFRGGVQTYPNSKKP